VGRVHHRTAPFPRQPAAGGDGAERDHDNRPGLAVCQVGGDGAAEEFVHADPQAAAAAADDDHLCAEDVGSRPRAWPMSPASYRNSTSTCSSPASFLIRSARPRSKTAVSHSGR
jgi:hypothetical protein